MLQRRARPPRPQLPWLQGTQAGLESRAPDDKSSEGSTWAGLAEGALPQPTSLQRAQAGWSVLFLFVVHSLLIIHITSAHTSAQHPHHPPSRVFPVPGGPHNSTPLGILALSLA